MSRLLQLLEQQVLIADGGMGSMLHQRISGKGFSCTDEANLSHPEQVQRVHLEFLQAGSHMIETNTFGANRLKLRQYGLEDQVTKLNGRAVKLAREAREIAGVDAFIGGSIGPTGEGARQTEENAQLLHEVFAEQALALDDRGVDAFVLETFTSPWELAIAVKAVKSVSCLPVIAQMTLTASDDWSDDGSTLEKDTLNKLQALSEIPADVLGLNCALGPMQMLPALRHLASATKTPLAVQPNSGLPRRMSDRFLFPVADPVYFGDFAQQAIKAGARIIGGCCGTTPDDIKALTRALTTPPRETKVRPSRVTLVKTSVPVNGVDSPTDTEQSTLAERFANGEFVVSMQVDPPKGVGTKMVMEAVKAFREAGIAHAVDVNSNPMARLHMDALWLSALIEQQGLETIAHYTPRDASLMGIQGNLLGAWNMGVRNLLVITGDPSVVNGEPGGTDVYQTDSIGMVRTISELNAGKDCFGNTLSRPPNFYTGVAVNPNADDLDLEVERYKAKIDAGAKFAMTQVFFEWSCWERFLDKLGGESPIPVMAAVWPLTSLRLAVRLHNEVPGIVVPDHVLKRLEAAGASARKEGFQVAREMLAGARERTEGAYIIAPFKRPKAALELFDLS